MTVFTLVGIIGGFALMMYMMPNGGDLSQPEPRAVDDGAPAAPDERPAPRDPGKVDDELIDHIKNERYAAAYALTTSAYREMVGLDRFAAAVAGNPYLTTVRGIGCHDVTTWGDSVHVRKCILRAEAGNAFATLHYSLEDGEWFMTNIVIGGTPAFPGPDLPVVPAEADPAP